MGKSASFDDPDPVPASSPPATEDNADVVKVKQEQKKKAAMANGWQSTLVSGLGDNSVDSSEKKGLLG